MTPSASPSDVPWSRRPWLAPLLAFVATVLVYLPSLGNGFVWNDKDYVTKPALQSVAGLFRIWFEVGATEQYYPLLHSFFWVQHRLFGDSPFGYHLVNVLLHAACAALLVLVVRKLFAPSGRGESVAVLSGLIFAVHPVYVESVAWISEQKNTFSLLWYLLAGWIYLGISAPGAGVTSPRDQKPAEGTRPTAIWQNRRYWLATGIFLCALFSKSLTASLPAALLVLTWWRRGRIDWSRDVVPLLPWFVAGASMGLFTGWVEHTYIGAQGDDFALNPIERGVLAGRVIWFYLGKYFWPAELIFIYPRWTVSLATWWQWLFPAAALGLLAWLWAIRGRTRGPLAAYLLFVGCLVPTIGFFNVYAFKYSYVADHWNYLPSLALAVSGAWGLVWLAARIAGRAGRAEAVSQPRTGSEKTIAAEAPPRTYLLIATTPVLLLLAVLSVRQLPGYRDMETFYRTILRENPDCWLALNNMGLLELDRGRFPPAIDYFERTLVYRPKDPEPENNLGVALQRAGRNRDAIPHFEAAIRKWPDYANAYYNLGNALYNEGRFADAVAPYTEAVRLQPGQTGAMLNLGSTLVQLQRPEEGIRWYERVLTVRPDYPEARHALGYVQMLVGRPAEAVPHLREAVRLRPDNPDWLLNLALALNNDGKIPEAITVFQRALALRPDSSEIRLKYAVSLFLAGREQEAMAQNAEGRRLRDQGR